MIVAPSDVPWDLRAEAAWLDAKHKRSGSTKTLMAYQTTLAGFREALGHYGLRLDSPVADVADALQAWAYRPRKSGTKSGAPLAPASIAQRLAIISSFYQFARRRGYYVGENPADRVDRPKVEAYANARPLPAETVARRLAAIDRTTPQGSRDYALLTLGLITGRRSSELAALELRDLERLEDGRLLITWRRMKGDKTDRQEIDPVASEALEAWLAMAYPGETRTLMTSNTPVWLSYSRKLPIGAMARLSPRSVGYLCLKRLGTAKVHTLRHTFAAEMEEAGAKVSEIQAFLGHSSIATTGTYLRRVRPARNTYADKLAARFGLGGLGQES